MKSQKTPLSPSAAQVVRHRLSDQILDKRRAKAGRRKRVLGTFEALHVNQLAKRDVCRVECQFSSAKGVSEAKPYNQA